LELAELLLDVRGDRWFTPSSDAPIAAVYQTLRVITLQNKTGRMSQQTNNKNNNKLWQVA